MTKKTGKKNNVVTLVPQDNGEQPIIEIGQTEVKKALASFVAKENSTIQELYSLWERFNVEYFDSKLSYPLITVGKLNNKTLGLYTISGHELGIENHIQFNKNFVALNPMKRIAETLRHEMVHQWQDEVLYAKKGEEPKEGQKPRPKEWHNKDFKEMAAKCDFPANGANCTGNPAKMPAPQSYNRKFSCECIASNGYPVTVWSTREIKAICVVCKKPFRELRKNDPRAKTIIATQSHVEKGKKEDAIETEMKKAGYAEFQRFEKKAELNDFMDTLEGGYATTAKHGVYQKFHNQYQKGYRYWVAYMDNILEDVEQEQEAPDEKPKAKTAPKKQQKPAAPKKSDKKKQEPEPDTAAPVVELPKPVEELPAAVEPAKKKPAPAKKKPAPAKKQKPAPVDLSVVELPKVEEPAAVEPAPEEKPKRGRGRQKGGAAVKAVEGRSHTNPQDIIDLYKELNTIGAVAKFFGLTPAALTYQVKKHNIDLGKGTFGDGK